MRSLALNRKGSSGGKLACFAKPGYLPFEKRSAHRCFQLVARRHEKSRDVLHDEPAFTQWGTVFDDEGLAAAILDRLLHHSDTPMIQGEIYRLKQKRKAGLIGRTTPTSGA